MKTNQFIVILLLTLLILFPGTMATKNTDASNIINSSYYILPQLHFNDAGIKVNVTGELNPSTNCQISSQIISQSQIKKGIPVGSIIYHANNETTVFDNSGQELFTVDDSTATQINTFKGYQPTTFVHEVPNNSVIVDDGSILHVIYQNSRILTIIDNSKMTSNTLTYVPATPTTCSGFSNPDLYVEGAESPMISLPGQFRADWNVPSDPKLSNSYPKGTPIAIWNGFYGCAQGDPAPMLLQPVLEWYYYDVLMPGYPTTKQWTMSTWYLWGNGHTVTVNGHPITFIHSQRNFGIVPGDPIQGDIQINVNGYDATGTIRDLNPNSGAGASTLFLTSNTPNVAERMQTQNLYATVVLEGWPVDSPVYPKLNSSYLPGPVTFKNFVLTDYNGNNLLTTTPMMSFVNTQYWNPTTFADAGNLTVSNQWPSRITLVNNPDRVNPPSADFTTIIPGGVGLAYIQFRDLSIGSPILWFWDFGDSGTSIDQNPVHLYLLPGLYTVNLTVWNAGGFNSRVKSNYIIVLPFPPVSSFIVNVNSGNAPLTVQFNDTSTGNATNWNWSFGDGYYSTLINVSHTYTRGGIYNATLTVGNAGGNITSAPQTISVYPLPVVASFTATPTSGNAPLTVHFNDTSTNTPISWTWNFGDGNTSTQQNPQHIYVSSGDYAVPKIIPCPPGQDCLDVITYMLCGKYTVTLTATNASGNDTVTKTDLITVNSPIPPPIASFIATPTSGRAPLSVRFTDTSKGYPTSWDWDFGDGSWDPWQSTKQNPIHIFNSPGSYTTTLTASNSAGSASTSTVIRVTRGW